jgi:hypothetical protein
LALACWVLIFGLAFGSEWRWEAVCSYWCLEVAVIALNFVYVLLD